MKLTFFILCLTFSLFSSCKTQEQIELAKQRKMNPELFAYLEDPKNRRNIDEEEKAYKIYIDSLNATPEKIAEQERFYRLVPIPGTDGLFEDPVTGSIAYKAGSSRTTYLGTPVTYESKPTQNPDDPNASTPLTSGISGCECKGLPLYGKVRVVNSFATFKVKVVSSFADLNVETVNSFATSCGQWQFVDSFEDFSVEFVDSFEDFSISYVNSFPGTN